MNEFLNKLIQEAESKNFTKLEEFAEWYHSYGNPIFANKTSEIYKTDIAHSVPIFTWKNFQVELYIVHKLEAVGMHAHPYVQVIQKVFSPTNSTWGSSTEKLVFPNEHGKFVPDSTSISTMLLTYEKWHPNVTPTSLTVMWKGCTVGPIQEQEILRIYPRAEVHAGYADVTKGVTLCN